MTTSDYFRTLTAKQIKKLYKLYYYDFKLFDYDADEYLHLSK